MVEKTGGGHRELAGGVKRSTSRMLNGANPNLHYPALGNFLTY